MKEAGESETVMDTRMDDPRLTAYALGELDGEERREVEALVASSAEARTAVEVIRETAALLEGELAKEPAATLGESARLQIEARVLAGRIRRWAGFAAAACVVLLVGGFAISMTGPGISRSRESKRNEIQVAMGPEGLQQGTPSELSTAPADNQLDDAGKGLVKAVDTRKEVEGDSSKQSFTFYEQIKAQVVNEQSAGQEASSPKDSTSIKGTEIFNNESGSGRFILGGGKNKDVAVSGDGLRDATVSLGAEGRIGTASGGWRGNSTNHTNREGESVIYLNEERPTNPFDLDKIREYRGQSPVYPENGGETYDGVVDNPFFAVLQSPLSTFSIDVDTASYSNIRRMLNGNQLPPASAVRIEEMVNYFFYDYPQPEGDQPFSVNIETAACPWKAEHRLVRVGLKGREVPQEKRLPCNLVFLIDVSGSMNEPNKLPLVKQGLAMLVQRLSPEDRVAMVVYAGASGLALPSTPVSQKQIILDVIEHLEAGGSTNGGEGIQLAYKIAGENFDKEGVNRVILATDGDFNVGVTNQFDLVKLVEEKAKGGVFLSVLGFGMGNLKDSTLEKLADKGNGNYAYIDTFAEAKKVLVDQMAGTLVTIAKDVKIQIEFNPAQVASYRLIGYENRILAARDFNDDKKDAGEIGAGHTVTALYEIVPTSASTVGVDALKYQPAEGARRDSRASEDSRISGSDELLTLKLRYKQPNGDTSKLIETPVKDSQRSFDEASDDLRFAASVAGFGMMLRNSPHKGDWTYDAVLTTATRSMGKDASGYRAEFIDLVRKAKTLSGLP